MIEIEVGNTFTYHDNNGDNVKLKVVKGQNCTGCYFAERYFNKYKKFYDFDANSICNISICSSCVRTDTESVIFVEVKE